MAERNSKLGKMSSFFKEHFGTGKNNESEIKSKNKPLLAKNKEEASKTSVKKTFKNILSKVTNPIMKPILKASGKEDFEKSLNKITDTKIKVMSPPHSAIIYVKFLQLYGNNISKVIMKGTPKDAMLHIQALTNLIAETDGFKQETTNQKLILLSKRIKNITPLIWKGLIKIIDNAFDEGVDTVADLANTKSNISDTQVKEIIAQTSPSAVTHKESATNLANKKVVPSKSFILKQILDSVLTLNKAINSSNQSAIFSKLTSRIRNISNRLTELAKNGGQEAAKLSNATSTILKFLDNKKVGENEKNTCINYFKNLQSKNNTETQLGKEISITLDIFFKRYLYTQTKNSLKKVPRGNVEIGSQRARTSVLDEANKTAKQWEDDQKGFVEEAKRNAQANREKTKQKQQQLRRSTQNASKKVQAGSAKQNTEDLEQIIKENFSGKKKQEVPENLEDLLNDF